MPLFRLMVFAIAIVTLLQSPAAAQDLRLGVYPLLEVTEVVKRFTPLARRLEMATGLVVRIEVAADYQDHIDKTGRDTYDISYMGPASYISMVAKYGLKPILARLETNKNPTYRGAIIVRSGSAFSGMGDLKGRKFAFGDKGSTMGYAVPRHMLWKAGVQIADLAAVDYLKNQQDVALSVLAGHFDAGAVREQVYEEYAPRGLKVLAWSPPLSEHVLVAHSSMAPDLVERIRQAMYALNAQPEGLAALTAIQRSATALIPARDSDYDSLRIILTDLEKIEVKP